MELHIEASSQIDISRQKLEVVERKGLGHPDTLADGLAEAISRDFSNYCLQNFGYILHHNCDKTSILGGTAIVRFGGGEITSPITVNVNGRFSTRLGEMEIPYLEIIRQSSRAYLQTILQNIDPEKDLHIHTRLSTAPSPGFVEIQHPDEASRKYWFTPRGIEDLSELKRLHANDTSCGVGYAPLSPLEMFVLKIERELNSKLYKKEHPYVGTDIKIMGVRYANHIGITACVPLIAKHVESIDAYLEGLRQVQRDIVELSPIGYDTSVSLNTRDNLERPELYLTVTGSSIESGDEGVVGRGNRINGLITPMRLMSIEGVCGKNPVYHVGKLYNVLADMIAHKLHLITGNSYGVVIVSQSGRDLKDPWVVLVLQDAHDNEPVIDKPIAARCIDEVFDQLDQIRMDILSQRIALC